MCQAEDVCTVPRSCTERKAPSATVLQRSRAINVQFLRQKPKRFLPSVLRERAQSLGAASSSRPWLGVSHCKARVKMEAG